MSLLEIIFLCFFAASFAGLVAFFMKKAPLLAALPKTTHVFEKKENQPLVVLMKIKEKAENLPALKNFSIEILLQRILSKIRILALKFENKTGGWLESLRRKAQNDRNKSDKNALKQADNYWENLQKKDDNTNLPE